MQFPTIKFTYKDRIIDLEQILVFLIKPLFLLFIYFSVFGRNVLVGGLSGGLAGVLFGFAIFVLTAFHFLFFKTEKKVSPLFYLLILFFLLISIQPFMAYFVFDERSTHILRYSVEVGINFGLVFATYYLIRNRLITPKFFLYAFGLLGLIITTQIAINLADMTVVRRVTGLRGAINYTANSLAICAAVWCMIIYSSYTIQKESKFRLNRLFSVFCFIFVMFGILLTGSRSAMLAFLVGIVLLQLFGMKSKKFRRYSIVIMVLFGGLLGYIAINIDISLLLNRFTYEELSRMAWIRFDQYARSVNDMTFPEFLFGRPDLYTFDDSTIEAGRTVNTHNVILSLIRYNGIFAAITFLLILYVIYKNYFSLYKKNKTKPRLRITESSILVLLTMTIIYSMFSGGRSTRIFFLYIMIGYAVGYFEMVRTIKSEKEYEKLVL